MAIQSLNVTWSITIAAAGLRLTSPPPPSSGTVGVPYTHTFTVDQTTGVPPYFWVAVSLPSWMIFTPAPGGASCTISGTPTTAGTFSCSLQLTDSGKP